MNELLRLDSSERPLRRRLAAIAFLDVVGYSQLMAVNEDATLSAWAAVRQTVIEPQVIVWRGRVVDRAGDGIFAEFSSALDAVKWAVNVQTAVGRQVHPGSLIKLRIAVHLADVIDGRDGEVQGGGVNVTARLQNYAGTGGIIVSQAVVDAVQGKMDVIFVDLGQLRLRNISYPVHAFRLSAPVWQTERQPGWRRAIRFGLGTAVLLLVLLMSVFKLQAPKDREQAEQFLQQGLAIKCPEFPCAREWLEKRILFERAIAADPILARPYAEAALIYAHFVSSRLSTDVPADLHAASSLAMHAVALAPTAVFAHNARAAVLRQDPEKLEEALTALHRVLTLDPTQVMARANAGWILILLGRPEEAEQYVQAAIDADPANISAPAWLNRMGLAELFLGREGHGAAYFRRAIQQESRTDAMADVGLERAINLAAALALDGDVTAGQAVIKQLRQQYPTISTNNIWSCTCSHAARFQAGMTKLRKGAILAGVTDYN